MRIYPVLDAGQLRLALLRLMRPDGDMHIHAFLTGAFHIAHRACQLFGILALPCLPLLRSGSTLFFREALAQLDILELLFSLHSFGLSTKGLRVSSLELSFRWCLDSSASFDGLGFFSAMVGDDCVPVDGASVGDWVHISRGVAGRRLQGKESGGNLYLKQGQKRREGAAVGGPRYAPYVFTKS